MSSLYRSILFLVAVPCLFLASCVRPPVPPVPSAALQQAFKGPLCTRLDGVEWPCNDIGGHLWKEWWLQQSDYRHQQDLQAIEAKTTAEGIKSVILGSLSGLGRSGYGHYHYHGSITTRCSYGTYRSSCTTRY